MKHYLDQLKAQHAQFGNTIAQLEAAHASMQSAIDAAQGQRAWQIDLPVDSGGRQWQDGYEPNVAEAWISGRYEGVTARPDLGTLTFQLWSPTQPPDIVLSYLQYDSSQVGPGDGWTGPHQETFSWRQG